MIEAKAVLLFPKHHRNALLSRQYHFRLHIGKFSALHKFIPVTRIPKNKLISGTKLHLLQMQHSIKQTEKKEVF